MGNTRPEGNTLRPPLIWLSRRDEEKPSRVVALTAFLREEGIETVAELGAWLQNEAYRTHLLTVPHCRLAIDPRGSDAGHADG